MNDMYKKLLKFLSFGLLTYWSNVGITYVCMYTFLLWASLSYWIALLFTTTISFLISLKSVFNVEFTITILYKYLLILFSMNISNYFLVLHLNNFYSQGMLFWIIILVTTFFAVVKFILYDKFVFIKK